MKYLRITDVIGYSLLSTWLLFYLMTNPLFDVHFFDKEILNFYANYEFSTILISFSFLLVLYYLADKLHLSYLNVKKIDAAVKAVPLIGLKHRPNEGWRQIGLNIGAIIPLVTGIVLYLQVAAKGGLSIRLFPEITLILLFALMNSFTEEVIFRLSYTTIIANEGLPSWVSEMLSALIFGTAHYFGIAPNGIVGAIMAGFIGWFLAKSINESKGFFWAWAIHFAQDVVIMFFLFMAV